MRSLRSSKCLKTTVELTFTAQKANAISSWTAYSVFLFCFQLETPFLSKFGPKLKIISLSWNFVPRPISNMQNSMVMSTFSVFDWKYFLGKFGPKNQNCQFELKFHTRLIWICRIMQKLCGVHFSCFRPEKPFLNKSRQKNQNCQLKQKFGTKRLIWICGIQWWC